MAPAEGRWRFKLPLSGLALVPWGLSTPLPIPLIKPCARSILPARPMTSLSWRLGLLSDLYSSAFSVATRTCC